MNIYNYSCTLNDSTKNNRKKKKLSDLLVKADNVLEAQKIAENYVKNKQVEYVLILKDVKSFV